MSKAPGESTQSCPSSPLGPDTSQTQARLRAAVETARPVRLRRTLQDLYKTIPDTRKVTAALLIATQDKYKKKIEENRSLQSEDEDEEYSRTTDDEKGVSESSAEDKDDQEESESTKDEAKDDTADDEPDPSPDEEEENTDEEADDTNDDEPEHSGDGEEDNTDEEEVKSVSGQGNLVLPI